MSAANTTAPWIPLAMVEPQLRWWEGELVAGHGVASGRANDSPSPAGTIQLQRPHFAAAGIDLSPFEPATLNLAFRGGRWRLRAWPAPTTCWPPRWCRWWWTWRLTPTPKRWGSRRVPERHRSR